MEYVPRIDSLLSSGKEEKVPLFEIQFPLDSVFMHFKIGIYWRRGEIWARKNTKYINGADGWRETQFQSWMVWGARWSIFYENNNRKSIKNISQFNKIQFFQTGEFIEKKKLELALEWYSYSSFVA